MAEDSKMAGTSDDAAKKQPYNDMSATAPTNNSEANYDLSPEQNDGILRPERKNDIMIQPEPHGPAKVELKDPVAPAHHDGEKTGNVTVDVEKGGISPAPTQTDSREQSEEPVSKSS